MPDTDLPPTAEPSSDAAPPSAPEPQPTPPSKTWERVREYTGVIGAPLALTVSLLGLWISHDATRIARESLDEARDASRRTTQVEVNQVLAEAWDLMGGEVGTTTIMSPPRDSLILERARRLIEDVALVKDPHSARAHYHMGTYWLCRGDLTNSRNEDIEALNLTQRSWEEAEASYRRALELNSEYAAAHLNLGTALSRQGKLEAAASYRRALELNPEYLAAQDNYLKVLYNNISLKLTLHGNWEAAEAGYRQAVALAPESASAHNRLAYALEQQGRLKEAVASYRRALELDPGLKMAQSSLARALRHQATPPAPTK